MKEMILKGLPKKYHVVLDRIEEESGLVDGCKYMMYFTDEYFTEDYFGSSYPVKNVTEARAIIKDVYEVIGEPEKTEFYVKDTKVEITENDKLRFEKGGEIVEIDRDSILGDYRKVYNYLKSKTNRRNDDFKEVGSFIYKIENNTLLIHRKSNNELIAELDIKDEDIKYLRNYVINYLINNL